MTVLCQRYDASAPAAYPMDHYSVVSVIEGELITEKKTSDMRVRQCTPHELKPHSCTQKTWDILYILTYERDFPKWRLCVYNEIS